MVSAPSSQRLDKAAFNRLVNMMGKEGEMPDKEWKGMCSHFGASPEEGLTESIFSEIIEGAPLDQVQGALTKLREEAVAQAKVELH